MAEALMYRAVGQAGANALNECRGAGPLVNAAARPGVQNLVHLPAAALTLHILRPAAPQVRQPHAGISTRPNPAVATRLARTGPHGLSDRELRSPKIPADPRIDPPFRKRLRPLRPEGTVCTPILVSTGSNPPVRSPSTHRHSTQGLEAWSTNQPHAERVALLAWAPLSMVSGASGPPAFRVVFARLAGKGRRRHPHPDIGLAMRFGRGLSRRFRFAPL